MDIVSFFRLKNVHLLPAFTVWKKPVLLLLLLPDPSFPFKGQAMKTQLPLNPLLQCSVPGGILLVGDSEMKRGSARISLSLSKSKP